MKKLLAIVLLLCMLCTCAFAEGNLVRTETRVVREKKEYSDEYDINVFIQFTNAGDAPIALDQGVLKLLDASGNVLVEESFYSMTPNTLNPGEVGYTTRTIFGVDAATATALASYEISTEVEDYFFYEYLPLEHTAVYEVLDDYGYKTGMVTFTIANNTQDILWNPIVLGVIRSADGKILQIVEEEAYDVGILPGNSIVLRTSVSNSDLERWNAAGYTTVTVESHAYSEIDN